MVVVFALLESITDEERKWQGISELWRELSEISKEMFSFFLKITLELERHIV